MSVEVPIRPDKSVETAFELPIPEVPHEEKAKLTDIGRVCLELALAQQDGEPIVGAAAEINELLEERTGLDHEILRATVHDIIHGDSANIVYVENLPVKEGRSLALTPEAITALRGEIASLQSDAAS